MHITDDIIYVGVNDYTVDLFEGLYPVPNGMAYNSYLILDQKIAVMDTVDKAYGDEWLEHIRKNLETQVKGQDPDYLIVQHMEPDHSANVCRFMEEYPEAIIVASAKAFEMMRYYFHDEFTQRRIVVSDEDILSLGKHKLIFRTALMVHWPEVIVTYDATDKVLFSADGFGKFGALDAEDPWLDEARRYYFGIVGKYGRSVQLLLSKLSEYEIHTICSLHGPVLREPLSEYLNYYSLWSQYLPEEEGVLIAYTSVYGNTAEAIEYLAEQMRQKRYEKVVVRDLARCDRTAVIAEAFRYNKIVFATTTYNLELFPYMREFINDLTERNFANRTIAIIENGSWMPVAAKKMEERFQDCPNVILEEPVVTVKAALTSENRQQLELLAEKLSKKM